ncbi:MAG: ABC transporter permease [Methanomassiliicoccales archaeon]|jgi:ABC-2 type transport system permease protein
MADLYNINKDIKVEVPSDTAQVFLVAKYDILKHIRSKRLLAIGIILGLVLVLVTFLGTLNNPDPHNAARFVGNYAGFANTMIVIGVTLFAGDAIVSEFQNRTGYLLFPNPVKKSSLYAGKFLASVGIMSFVIVIYYLVAIVIGLAYTGNFTELAIYSMLLAILYGAAATGLAFLISSVLKTSTASLVLTFFMLFMILSLITAVGSIAGVKPDGELTFAGGTISYIMEKPYPVDNVTSIRGAGFTLHTYIPDVGLAVIVELVWLTVTAMLGYVAFSRREMVS